MDKLFVDTSAYIALLSGDDQCHARAELVYRALSGRYTLVTTNHIVDEVCGWFARRGAAGHRVAVQFAESMLSSPGVVHCAPGERIPGHTTSAVVYGTTEIERAALAVLKRYDTAGFSFTDCVSFAVMEALGIGKAFTYDEHFEVMGFKRIG